MRRDERIRDEVSEVLAEDGGVDASDIEVTVKNGEVTLSGAVRDRRQKRRAEELSESCIGVVDVQNALKIDKDSPARAAREKRGTVNV